MSLNTYTVYKPIITIFLKKRITAVYYLGAMGSRTTEGYALE
ncbi:MAG: hypothetical protein RL131_213 [Bacteroidota bacterium]